MAGFRSHLIVFGNEKGGTGKSTLAMHVVASLMVRHFSVAVIDLDHRQKTITRYIENRISYAKRHQLKLDTPKSITLPPSLLRDKFASEQEDKQKFSTLIRSLSSGYDFTVIDCPGHDTALARLAYIAADTLITPLNDSFIDLDLLGNVDPDSFAVNTLSHFSELIWESRKQHGLLPDVRSLDWIVTRNRLSSLDARNKRQVDQALRALAKRVSFRYLPGLSERVIYRELFPKGLTLVDFIVTRGKRPLTMSHVAARHEMRELMNGLNLPAWNSDEVCLKPGIAD
ncbi:MAG TPA: ATPase [Gammaproteobacteria bacterium]|nr:ATPase [Gammaproteobacteria bacterium]